MITPSDLIVVKQTRSKGRGVFARSFIPAGAVIERAPILLIPVDDLWNEDGNSRLAKYVFAWDDKRVALALGFGSLYNHSYSPNATYEDTTRNYKTFRALRDIQPGEEITINYNGDPACKTPVGFRVIDKRKRKRAPV